MIVSQTAEYALRAMVHLARVPKDTWSTGRDVSQATGIPLPYAAKVLRKMVAANLLLAQKGHHGGFQLAKPPGRIRFADVLDAVEEDLFEKRCAFGWGKCNNKNPCPLHNSVSELKESVSDWARRTTLSDAAKTAQPLPPAQTLRAGGDS